MALHRHRDVEMGRKSDGYLHNFCLPPTAKNLLATGQYLARTNDLWPVYATIPIVAPPACVPGCGRKFLFCRWSSTPPKNWTFLGRLLVSQNAANIAKRHADQTRSGAPRLVGLLHRISTGTPVLCAFPLPPTAIFLFSFLSKNGEQKIGTQELLVGGFLRVAPKVTVQSYISRLCNKKSLSLSFESQETQRRCYSGMRWLLVGGS